MCVVTGVIKVISSGYQHRQPSPGERVSLSKVEINNETHKSLLPTAPAAYEAHSGRIKNNNNDDDEHNNKFSHISSLFSLCLFSDHFTLFGLFMRRLGRQRNDHNAFQRLLLIVFTSFSYCFACYESLYADDVGIYLTLSSLQLQFWHRMTQNEHFCHIFNLFFFAIF